MYNPEDLQFNSIDPMQGNRALMLNALASSEQNPLAAPVASNALNNRIDAAAAPFNHYSHYGLDESHLGERDANGNRVVNAAGMKALQANMSGPNRENNFGIADNTSSVDSAVAGSQQAGAKVVQQAPDMAAKMQTMRGSLGKLKDQSESQVKTAAKVVAGAALAGPIGAAAAASTGGGGLAGALGSLAGSKFGGVVGGATGQPTGLQGNINGGIQGAFGQNNQLSRGLQGINNYVMDGIKKKPMDASGNQYPEINPYQF